MKNDIKLYYDLTAEKTADEWYKEVLMRRKLIMVIFFALILTACSKSNVTKINLQDIKSKENEQVTVEQSSTHNSTGTTAVNSTNAIDNQIDQIAFKVNKVDYNGKLILLIEPTIPQNTGIGFVDFFTDQQIIIGVGYQKNENESYIALFMLDIDSDQLHEIYRGEGYADNFYSHLVVPQEGDFLFQTEKFIISIDRENFKVRSYQALPNFGTEYILSNSGAEIAYRNENGLFVSDLTFKNPLLLVESYKGKDPNGLDSRGPGFPRWSLDDSKIVYLMYLYEGSEGFGVVKKDGSELIKVLKPELYPTFAYIFSNNEKILFGQDVYEGCNLSIHNLIESTEEPIKIEGNWQCALPHPFEEKIIYAAYHSYIDSQLFLYDHEQKSAKPITPVVDAINAIKWNKNYNKIIVSSNNRKILIVPINE